jgi:hypothetical protein
MHPSVPDTDCSLAYAMSIGYPATADWQQVTMWLHLLAAIEFSIFRPEADYFISRQWDSYLKYKED